MSHRAFHIQPPPVPRRRRRGLRRGFTLAEAAMASAVLGLIMLAVATAIGAAQQMAFESQKRLFASIAADDLLVEISTLAYDDLSALNGRASEIGAMQTLDRELYPDSFWALGRSVSVRPETMEDAGTGAAIEGRLVTVACYDAFTTLAEYELFVPDPSFETVDEGEREGGGVAGGMGAGAPVGAGGMGGGGR